MPLDVPQLSFTGGEITPSLYGRTDLRKYAVGVKQMRNFVAHPHGGASNRGGTEFVCEVKFPLLTTRLIPFQFSVVQSYVLEFGDLYMRVIKDGGQVLDGGSPVEIVTPYAHGDVERIRFVQSADVIYLVHPDYQPQKLSRTSHIAWAITPVDFQPGIDAPTNLTGTGNNAYLKVTAVDANGDESNGSVEQGTNDASSIGWDVVTGATLYRVYKKVDDIFYFLADTGTNSYAYLDATVHDVNRTLATSGPTFDSANNYPGCATFFEQRLLFGRTDNEPQTLWGSQTGNFENFNSSIPLRDDDSYEFTLNSTQVNEIQSLIPMTELIIATSGEEWKMNGGGGAITPTNVNNKVQSRHGASDVAPLVVGDNVLFIQNAGSKVRSLAYSLEKDGYASDDLSLLANHLIKYNYIKDWCYQRDPDPVAWAVRDDGLLLGLTYAKEHEVFAWHRHDTQGLFKWSASISTGDGSDEVYFVVQRDIDGASTQYIERFMPRLPHQVLEDAWFVDSGLFRDGAPTTTLSGLDHLEGKEVAIFADGNSITGKTVVGGEITLDIAAEKVLIGLGYTCDIETLDFEAPTETGSLTDKLRNIAEVQIDLADSRQLWVGPAETKLSKIIFREQEVYGAPVNLYNGVKRKSIKPGSGGKDGGLFMRVTDPVPCSVLSVVSRFNAGSI